MLSADFQLQAGIPGQRADEAIGLLALTNTSDASCTVNGYPTLHFLNEANEAIDTATTPTPVPGPPETFDIGPGRTAFAGVTFTIGDGSGATCQTASALSVLAPGDSAPIVTQIGGVNGGGEVATPSVCGGSLTVGTLQPASQGVLFS